MTSLSIPKMGAVSSAIGTTPLANGKRHRGLRCGMAVLAILALLGCSLTAFAFPPAPHHLIYGTVRDQYGTPLMTDQAQVVLITPTGVQLTTTVVPGLAFDVNYQLEVPMDAGLTADPYEPDALMPGAAFSMCVVIGQTTNFPIQMTGSLAQLGQPGQQNRIDLTLGVDSNGDGIPDAWESAYLSELGSTLGLGNLNANSVIGPSGMTLRQEFLAGYYPYDPGVTFTLQILSANQGSSLLQFTAATGRYYTLLGSPDFSSWTPISFRVPSEGVNGPVHTYYYSTGIQTVQVQAIQPGSIAPPILGFGLNGNQITLSWPTNSAGFNLVSANSLAGSSWQPVVGSPQVVGNNFVLTNAMSGSARFFRLSSNPVRYFRLMLQ